jgi:hypothetical protein
MAELLVDMLTTSLRELRNTYRVTAWNPGEEKNSGNVQT